MKIPTLLGVVFGIISGSLVLRGCLGVASEPPQTSLAGLAAGFCTLVIVGVSTFMVIDVLESISMDTPDDKS